MTKQKEEPNGTYEWEYAQKVDTRTTGQKILNFIYNPQTHAFLGRTAKSWGGIILFYAIFYSVLALLFAVCMKVLISTLETSQPKWQLEDSIIGTNPGLGFRPRTIDPETASIIWYHANDTKNVDSWVKLVDKFFEEEYTVKNNSKTAVYDCDYGKKVQPLHFCVVKPEDFGPCSKANGYGYPAGKPCVFLKLNRIYRWEPDCYTNKTELPIEMPDELQQLIGDVTDEKRRHNVWVSCEGQSAHDRENMGLLKYYPKIQGFPSYYYPYTHADNYMSPLVAVQFAGIRPGVTVNIECKAWAKNIKHKATSLVREGSVHFEILIDMAK